MAALGSGLQTPVNYWPSRPASGTATPGLVICGAATPLRASFPQHFSGEAVPPMPSASGAVPTSVDSEQVSVTRRVRVMGRSRTMPVAPVMEAVQEESSFQEKPEPDCDSPSTGVGESLEQPDSSKSDLYLDSVDFSPERDGSPIRQ